MAGARWRLEKRRYWPLVNPNMGLSTNETSGARVMRAEADGPAAVA